MIKPSKCGEIQSLNRLSSITGRVLGVQFLDAAVMPNIYRFHAGTGRCAKITQLITWAMRALFQLVEHELKKL
jgi:hypothetical protein